MDRQQTESCAEQHRALLELLAQVIAAQFAQEEAENTQWRNWQKEGDARYAEKSGRVPGGFVSAAQPR